MKLLTFILAGLVGSAMLCLAQTPSAYYLSRVGLFNDPVYTNPGPLPPGTSFQDSLYQDLTDSGFATGFSWRYTSTDAVGKDFWVANAISGVTHRVGLTGPNVKLGNIDHITESALVIGNSELLVNSGGSNPSSGFGTWLADAVTGVTVRTGLYNGAEFTSTTGIQASQNHGITENGLVYGTSWRYSGNVRNGDAAWLMNTDNGVTSRIGFTTADYTRNDGYQQSIPIGISDLGYVAGNSARYQGIGENGSTAWVAARINGQTYPLGLHQPPLYLSTSGFGSTQAVAITNSGYAIGSSQRFNGLADVGRAAWVHNLNNNTVKRLGLTTYEYTHHTAGIQYSESTLVSETGFVGGYSLRFDRSLHVGQDAWVASSTDGVSVRAGLTSAEFTRPGGYRSSELDKSSGGLTAQGNAYGLSQRYADNELNGKGAWVFNKSTGATTRVGFYTSPIYTHFTGLQDSSFYPYPASNAGWIAGRSFSYSAPSDRGETAWIASTTTGVTTQVGLDGPDYTNPNGLKTSTISGLTAGNQAYGISSRYVAGNPLGQAAWTANFNNTGATVRIGLFGTSEFVLANGSEDSVIEGATQSGYVWGCSSRAEASGGGQVAWVYNLNTGAQQTFKVQVAPDGKTSTTITEVTENGLVSGNYTAYDPTTSARLGTKNFVWSPAKGIIILEDQFGAALPANNWTTIGAFKLNRHGLIVAIAQRGPATPAGKGVFRAYFAP